MTDYQILSELGRGVQGVTYLVENEAGKKFVMKQIECADKNYSTHIFKQLLNLQGLEHRNIAVPRDVFISWKNETSSIQVNAVYEYYNNGNLATILANRRKENAPLEKAVLTKWVGLLLDALLYLHKKGFIHRNLKPSNIYLSPSNGLVLSDVGLQAIVSDVATRTRTTDGRLYKYTDIEYLNRFQEEPASMSKYLAPEVLQGQPHTKTSDVFSLALIFLEMVTIGELTTAEVDSLQTFLQTSVTGMPSSPFEEMSCLIQQMVMHHPEARSTIEKLAEGSFVSGLLEQAQTEQIEKKRAISAAVPHRSVPTGKGVEAIVVNMSKAHRSETVVRETLKVLLPHSVEDLAMKAHEKHAVVNAAKFHIEVVDIQEAFFTLLFNSLPFCKEDDEFYSLDTCVLLNKVIRKHCESRNILNGGFQIILALCAHEKGAANICRSGCLNTALEAMEEMETSHKDLHYIIKTVCWIVWSVAAYSCNEKILIASKTPQRVMSLVSTGDSGESVTKLSIYQKDENVMEAFLAALWSLSTIDESTDELKKVKGVDLLLDLITSYKLYPRILRNICLALANFIENDEHVAYQVLASGGQLGGLALILDLFPPHRDNPEMIQALCVLCAELSVYDEICYEMATVGFKPALTEASILFASNKEITEPSSRALDNLKAYSPATM